MSKKYINEAVSMNGKIAYNENNVSFKTNSVAGILQHLAWQYSDTFIGTLKNYTADEVTGLIGNTILNLSSNGSPLIFSDLSENKVSFEIESGGTIQMLHLNYAFTDNPDLMQYVDANQVEFIITIVNGIWVIINKMDNEVFFEKFVLSGGTTYTTADLPTVKIPKAVSQIDNVGTAKSALRAFAKEQNLNKYAISSFTPTEVLSITANPSMSRFSSFMPDFAEFANITTNVSIEAGQEIPYLVDEDNKRLLFINLGSSFGNKWHLIQDRTYIDFITNGGQNYFVDSVKNAVMSAELNQGVKIKEIYDLIARQRLVGLAGKIQPSFDKSGYFIASVLGKTIPVSKFTKLSVDTKGNVNRIMNTKDLVLYKDSIVLYSANLTNNIVMLSLPKKPEEVFITSIEEIGELYNEFYNYDPSVDTVLSINDAYFDTQK